MKILRLYRLIAKIYFYSRNTYYEVLHMSQEIEVMKAAFANLQNEVNEARDAFLALKDKLAEIVANDGDIEEYKAAVSEVSDEMNGLANQLDVAFGTQAPAPTPEPTPEAPVDTPVETVA